VVSPKEIQSILRNRGGTTGFGTATGATPVAALSGGTLLSVMAVSATFFVLGFFGLLLLILDNQFYQKPKGQLLWNGPRLSIQKLCLRCYGRSERRRNR